ncbi:hypothetical protein CCR85_10895 [Rhodothalassium salexigens]|uniref:hypothetical protein n=1 Tax=Rhodothalassium salexigens TaxID=1086 RepID=UPI00191320B3|nr:hypothetical protein [Rhodothalassium salexigens]MBK5911995.1 hypothetical protein [Rhodothalassium salexigens]
MASFILNPGDSRTIDTREGGDTLSLTNNHEDGEARYAIAFDHQTPTNHTLAPGTSANYDLTDHETAALTNTGDLTIEVDFE